MSNVAGNIVISTDKNKLDINLIHSVLTRSYWAEGISLEIVKRSIENSICFGVYFDDQQVGFARVVTDKATFAYLADVFIVEKFRGHGLSKKLMKFIMAQPELKGLRRIMLATRDAHGLYEGFGFSLLTYVERWMQIHNTDVYKN